MHDVSVLAVRNRMYLLLDQLLYFTEIRH